MRGQKWKNVASFQQRRGEEKREEDRKGNIILGRENAHKRESKHSIGKSQNQRANCDKQPYPEIAYKYYFSKKIE